MMIEPSARISRCRTPTALVAASSERKELEQTSSASRLGAMRGGRCSRAHLVQHDRNAGLGRLPRRLRAREAAADDVNGTHGLSLSSQAGASTVAQPERPDKKSGPEGRSLTSAPRVRAMARKSDFRQSAAFITDWRTIVSMSPRRMPMSRAPGR